MEDRIPVDGYVYRIYTEDKKADHMIAELMQAWGFPGFTMYDTVGYWQGASEQSLVIEVVIEASPDPLADYHKIRAMAWAIGNRLEQEEVLVTMEPVTRIGFVKINR